MIEGRTMKKKVILISLIALFIMLLCFSLFITSKYAITLNGEKTIQIELGEQYQEKGAQSILNLKQIEIDGKVDTKKVGKYEIKYHYFYSYITRTINVVDKEKPVINLNGNGEVNLALNGTYIEYGYNASDNYDGDITDKVEITNNIDLNKAGIYEVVYKVSDSSGNETVVTRNVSVNEKGPLSMSLEEYNLDGYFDTTILKETERADDSYINETVFYGDSITENFAYYEALPWNVVWAKASLTPENAHTWQVPIWSHNTSMTLVDALKAYKPKRLVITLGANAVAIMTENYFMETYESLVKKAKEASPETLVIIQSIFPVDVKWDTHANTKKSINNTKINRLNYLLAEMCERNGVKFLNSATVLKDETGRLRKGYGYESDGIHLLPEGNSKVIEYFRTHAYIEGE